MTLLLLLVLYSVVVTRVPLESATSPITHPRIVAVLSIPTVLPRPILLTRTPLAGRAMGVAAGAIAEGVAEGCLDDAQRQIIPTTFDERPFDVPMGVTILASFESGEAPHALLEEIPDRTKTLLLVTPLFAVVLTRSATIPSSKSSPPPRIYVLFEIRQFALPVFGLRRELARNTIHESGVGTAYPSYLPFLSATIAVPPYPLPGLLLLLAQVQ